MSVVGHTTKQMKHGRSCPSATFSTSGSSYLNVALTTVHHLYNVFFFVSGIFVVFYFIYFLVYIVCSVYCIFVVVLPLRRINFIVYQNNNVSGTVLLVLFRVATDDRERSRFSTKFAVELCHQLFEHHVLLSAVDPPHAAACPRLHRCVCLALLLTSLLTLTAVWFSCVHSASQRELMTGASVFSSSDVTVAAVVAVVSCLLAVLPLEMFHRDSRHVGPCSLYFGNI